MSLDSVLTEVRSERIHQDYIWGIQDHPDANPHLLREIEKRKRNRPRELAKHYGIPEEEEAKQRTETAFDCEAGSFTDILFEEFCEAVSAIGDDEALREELIQVAAVAVKWVESIDKRSVSEIETVR